MATIADKSFEFGSLSLVAVNNHVENGFERLHKLNSFLKKAGQAEESYAKELQKLLKEFGEGEKEDNSPVNSLVNSVKESFQKIVNQHLTHSSAIGSSIAVPLKEYRTKADKMRQKMQTESNKLLSSTKEIIDKGNKEKGTCQKLFDSWKVQIENEKSGNVEKNTQKSFFGGGNKTIDRQTVSTTFTKYKNGLPVLHQQQKTNYENETRLLRELQVLYEEKTKQTKLFLTQYVQQFNDIIAKPFASITHCIQTSLDEVEVDSEVRSVFQHLYSRGCRDPLNLYDYGFSFSPSDVLKDNFNPVHVQPYVPPVKEKEPLTGPAAAALANLPSNTSGNSIKLNNSNNNPSSPFNSLKASAAPTSVKEDLYSPPATSTNNNSVNNTPTPSAPAKASETVDESSDTLSSAPLPMIPPKTDKIKKLSSNLGLEGGAAVPVFGAPMPIGVKSPKSSTTVTSPTSSVASPSGNTPTLLRVLLPPPNGYVTLSSSICPSVGFIKKKLAAKITRTGTTTNTLTEEIILSKGVVYLLNHTNNSGGNKLEDTMSMLSLLGQAEEFYGANAKQIELELVVEGLKRAERSNSDHQSNNPNASQQSSNNNGTLGVVSTKQTEFVHAKKPKMGGRRKKATRKGLDEWISSEEQNNDE